MIAALQLDFCGDPLQPGGDPAECPGGGTALGVYRHRAAEGGGKGNIGVLRDHTGKGGACGVHHIVDGEPDSGEHLLIHPVDDEPDVFLAGELQQQGEIPVQIIMDYLVFGKEPEQQQIFTDIRVLVKESL